MSSSNDNETKEQFFQRQAEELQELKTRAAKIDLQVREHEAASDVLANLPEDRCAFRMVGDILMEQTAGEALQQVKSTSNMLSDTLKQCVERSLQIEKEAREMAAKVHELVSSKY